MPEPKNPQELVERNLMRAKVAFTTLSLVVPLALWLPNGAASTAEPAATCEGLAATIVGTDGDDNLQGTPGPDVIVAGAGNDNVAGLGGDDVICGQGDEDVLEGGTGDDTLVGGADRQGDEWGEDKFFWFGDTLVGGAGDDDLVADGPDVATYIPQGRDTISYADAPRSINARLDLGTVTGQGTDTVSDANTVILSTHDDHAVAGGKTAQILGGDGDDVLSTAAGFAPPYLNQPVIDIPGFLSGGAGDDTITSRGRGWQLRGDAGRDVLTAEDASTMDGGFGSDRVHGSPLRDKVTVSRHGVDTVSTGAGADTIILGVSGLGLSAAHVWTGRGPDQVTVASAPVAGSTIDLGRGEDGIGFLIHAFDREQAPLPDVVVDAGPGVDKFHVPLMIAESGSPGSLPSGIVANLATGTARTRGTAATMRILGFEDLQGGPWRDVLIGSAGPNRIDGDDRIDILKGRGGDDILLGGDGFDRAFGGPGRDRCRAERTRDC
jgi:Ca2+-binding RTX toxin-like protein